MNGTHRVDLDGGIDVGLAITPFSYAMPIRRMVLDIGDEAPTVMLEIDVETLGVVPVAHVVRRLAIDRYEFAQSADDATTIVVDEHGLPLDVEGRFRRR